MYVNSCTVSRRLVIFYSCIARCTSIQLYRKLCSVVKLVVGHGERGREELASGDTAPCKVTPVILHGVVSPDRSDFTRGCIPRESWAVPA